MQRIAPLCRALLVSVLILGSRPSHAAPISGGILSGVDFATLYGTGGASGSKTGFQGGAFVNIGVSKNVSIQPELHFVMQGANSSLALSFFGSPAFTIENKVKLNYLEFPVLARRSFLKGPESKTSLSLFAGPALALLLTAKSDLSFSAAGTSVADSSFSQDIKNDTKSTDFRAVFGGGINRDLSKGSIGLDIRFSVGLLNIAKNTAVDPAVDPASQPAIASDAKNLNFAVMAAYSYPFGK